MIRCLPILLALIVPAAASIAQLPTMMVQPGVLRLEFGGSFHPAEAEYADGERRELGAPLSPGPLTAATSPLVANLDRQISAILGRPAEAASMGSLTSLIEFQRGIGTIGMAVGINRRLTAHASIPIVSVRTQSKLEIDAAGASLGLNPALAGDTRSEAFVAQFDAALTTLAGQIAEGAYADDPALQLLAEETLSEGPGLRNVLFQLLLSPTSSSAVLPLAESTDGAALLGRVADFRSRFTGQLGIPGFTLAPALPTSPIGDDDLSLLLDSPGGFGLEPRNAIPLVTLGDIDLGLTGLLFERIGSGRNSWLTAWVGGTVTLPTGTQPRADHLRDQGTGDGQMDVALSVAAEASRGSVGLRARAGWRMQMPGDRTARIGGRDEFLIPANRTMLMEWNPGDVMSLEAQPWLLIVDRLAITGKLAIWSRGDDAWSPLGVTTGLDDQAIANMGRSTGASAVVAGLGLAYAHSGLERDGTRKMPVEAGLSVERIAAASGGLVTDALTARVYFRVYKSLFSR